jgi:hypothetical protein
MSLGPLLRSVRVMTAPGKSGTIAVAPGRGEVSATTPTYTSNSSA